MDCNSGKIEDYIDWLYKLNITDAENLKCVLCNEAEESVDHLFVECSFPWMVWCSCFKWRGMSWVIPCNIKHLFEAWLEVGLAAGCSEEIMMFINFYGGLVNLDI